jgi:hypothetical protein
MLGPEAAAALALVAASAGHVCRSTLLGPAPSLLPCRFREPARDRAPDLLRSPGVFQGRRAPSAPPRSLLWGTHYLGQAPAGSNCRLLVCPLRAPGRQPRRAAPVLPTIPPAYLPAVCVQVTPHRHGHWAPDGSRSFATMPATRLPPLSTGRCSSCSDTPRPAGDHIIQDGRIGFPSSTNTSRSHPAETTKSVM